MRFKIKSTYYSISFTFFALLLLLIVFDKKELFLYTFAASVLHEFIHLFFICIFVGAPKEVKISFLGGEIVRENKSQISFLKEFIINISAPLFNIIVGIVFLLFQKEQFDSLCYINLTLGIFNLLPFYSFDGGRALECALYYKISSEKINKIIILSSVLIATGFTLFSVLYNVFYEKSLYLIFFSLFFIVSLVFKK